MRWQRKARVIIAVAAIVFAAIVASTLRRRAVPAVEAPVARTDPKAVVESAGGQSSRVNREREELRVDYDKLLTYPDGTTKMMGVKVTTERSGRTFIIEGKEGQVGRDESTVELVGDVRVTASDGLRVSTDRATYTEVDGMARATGAVTFSRGRMTGSGRGFTYDKKQDILTIMEQAVVHVAPDGEGLGKMDLTSGSLEFRRNDRLLRFDRMMKATHARQAIEADSAIAHLTEDEEHLQALELRGSSRIRATAPSPGGLQALSGRDIDLKYGADGESIEHATITGDAVMMLAGSGRQRGREIAGATLDLTLAPDGATPTALLAREHVRVNIPAEKDGVARAITAGALDSQGDATRGLTNARFSGDVNFSERGRTVNRTARSALLDAALAPGFASIDDARFSRNVRFTDADLTATSAEARYVLGAGTLELFGSEPNAPVPHIVSDRIIVDAARMNVTLDGPIVKATEAVKSVLQPKREGSAKGTADDVQLPSMLKSDQPVNVTAEHLDYDGHASKAVYQGNAQLWQGETRINAPSLTIDSARGDLTATGKVATVSVLLQEAKDGKKERVRSQGASQDFAYDNESRRATYTGAAHVSGPQGDLTSPRIELYLKESGDEADRVEAYESVLLRADARKTTGKRLTYFGDEGRYLVTGTPVTIVDECGRETTGRTLTFFRATDRIVVDGNEQIRTQTKGKSNCPGS